MVRQHSRCDLIASWTGVSGSTLQTLATEGAPATTSGGRKMSLYPPRCPTQSLSLAEAATGAEAAHTLRRLHCSARTNAGPGTLVCEKLLLARRKPGPQAMGVQLRLPPGEPCHEGECQPLRWDAWVTHPWGAQMCGLEQDSGKMCGFLTRSSSHSVFQSSSRLSHQQGSKCLAVPTAPQTRWGSPTGSRTEVTPTWSPGRPNVDYIVLSVQRGNSGWLLRADFRV